MADQIIDAKAIFEEWYNKFLNQPHTPTSEELKFSEFIQLTPKDSEAGKAYVEVQKKQLNQAFIGGIRTIFPMIYEAIKARQNDLTDEQISLAVLKEANEMINAGRKQNSSIRFALDSAIRIIKESQTVVDIQELDNIRKAFDDPKDD